MMHLLLALQIAAAVDTTKHFEREVMFTDEVRAYLNEQWDEVRAEQVERAYCLFVLPTTRERAPTDTIDLVVGAFRAITIKANTSQIAFNCGPKFTAIHIHPPTTCSETKCELGGRYAYLCAPSPQDVYDIRARQMSYGIIQCAKNGFVIFYGAPGAGGVP